MTAEPLMPDKAPFERDYIKSRVWMSRTNCKDIPVEWFFPPTREEQEAMVGEFCLNCSVQLECLAYALLIDAREGVWGGQTNNAREQLRKGHFLDTLISSSS